MNDVGLCWHAHCKDKVGMYLGRMHLLLQRLKRNRNFSRPAFAGIKAASRDYVEVGRAACACC
jgi:Ser/Thr protein kinase RdoA (MazF antagonist)